MPDWLAPTVARMEALLALPENWNGEGALRVDRQVFGPLIALLTAAATPNTPPPSVVPTVSGGIQIEWHTNGIDLEIEAASPGELIAVFEDHLSGEEFDGEFSPTAPALTDAIRRVSQQRPALSSATADAE